MRMEHGLQGRVRQQQHGLGDICINRTLIKKRLLVEFSCKFPHHTFFEVYSLVRLFVLCDKWLLQQQNSTILWDSALHRLLFLLTYSFIILDHEPYAQSQEETKPDPRRKGGYQSSRQSLTGQLHICSCVYIGCITLCGRGRQYFSCRRLVLQDPIVTHLRRAAAQSIKEHLDQRFPAQGYQLGI